MFNPIDALTDHIHGDRFVEPCDFYWNDRGQKLDGLEAGPGIVFCKTDYLPELFDRIRSVPHKYVLVSHNSDLNVDQVMWDSRPPNIVVWLAQNVLIENPALIPIPIGLERPGIGASGDLAAFQENLSGEWSKGSHVFANWNDGTNPAERTGLKGSLRQQAWCTVQDDRVPLRHFLAELRRHVFVVCPPGNGSDTHRMWETLYSGSIPVCKDNPHNRMFARILPIVLYQDASDITLERLLDEREMIRAGIRQNIYTFQGLRSSFWHNLIRFQAKITLKS